MFILPSWSCMWIRCLRWFAHLPLPLIHGVGWLLGWLIFLLSVRYRQRVRENLQQAQLMTQRRCVIGEAGKMLAELLPAWLRSPTAVRDLVVEVRGWEAVTEAQASGQGLIFVTPHLGGYDIAGRYLHGHFPITYMYRPPKLAWVETLMNAGREREGAHRAPADVRGVRLLLKALKAGEATIVLPDQVPTQGDGAWAHFFGKPAYTSVLVPRLAAATGAAVLWFYGERLPHGRGFVLHFSRNRTAFNGDKEHDAQLMNDMVEQLVRAAPTQYLWSYNRYKTPSHAAEKT